MKNLLISAFIICFLFMTPVCASDLEIWYIGDSVGEGPGTGTFIVNGETPTSYSFIYSYTFSTGNQVTVEAVPNAYSVFDGWTGDMSGSSNPLTFRMPATGVSITGTFSEAYPDISVSPSSANFGTISPGESSEKSFLVSNTGSYTLSVDAPNVTGSDASYFNITDGASAVTVAPGDKYYIDVMFLPHSSGSRSATLVIGSDDPDEDPVMITLTGTCTGISPILPDIVVKKVDVLDGAGPALSFRASVRNAGDAPGTAGFLNRFYLSTDDIITTADTQVGEWTAAIPLAPAEFTTSDIITFNAAGIPDGTYYLGLITDALGGIAESDESNNTGVDPDSSVILLTGSGTPDLIVANVTVVDGTGPDLVFRATVVNQGDATASGIYTNRFYLSKDDVINTVDYLIYDWTISTGIAAGSSAASGIINVTVSGIADGTYFLGVIADVPSIVSESDESNNSGYDPDPPIVLVSVTGAPDLVVSDVIVLDGTGPSLSFRATVLNEGDEEATGGFLSRFYLSGDIDITTSDSQIAEWSVPGDLSPAEFTTSSIITVTPGGIPDGIYYLGVITDALLDVTESDDYNNTGIESDTLISLGSSGTPEISVLPDSLAGTAPDTLELLIQNTGSARLNFEIRENNWILNSGFEQGFDPWIFDDPKNAASADVDSSECYSGRYSVKCSVDFEVQPREVQLKQTGFQVTDGESYALSFWGKAEKPRTISTGLCRETVPRDILTQPKSVEMSAEWQYYSFVLKAEFPAGVSDPLSPEDTRFFFSDIGTDRTPFWIDDVKLQPLEEASGWLNLMTLSGTVAPGGQRTVRLALNSGNLSQGVYRTEFFIDSNDPDEPTLSIPVRLTVRSTAVESPGKGSIPSFLMLHPNYPNPFNPSTTIRFNLSEPCEVRLSVYDVAGREAAVIAEGRFTAGEHEVVFDGKSLASGVYICRLKAGQETRALKMILVK